MQVLLAYDGSNSAEAAIDDISRAGLPNHGNMIVLCIGAAEKSFSIPGHPVQRIQTQLPRWKVASEKLIGLPEDVILRATQLWNTDLLILGSKIKSDSPLLGNAALQVPHQVRCCVRVVPRRTTKSADPIRLVIGYDGSPGANAIVPILSKRAWPANTSVLIFSVFPPQFNPAQRSKITEYAQHLVVRLEKTGLSSESNAMDGDPRLDIVREAHSWNADAIFVGARDLSGSDRFLMGSVSTAVLTRAHCCVEVMR